MIQDNEKSSTGSTYTSSLVQPKPCDSFKVNEITSDVSTSLSHQASNIKTIADSYRASLSGNSTNFIQEQPTTNPSFTESEFTSASELLSYSPLFGNTQTSLSEQLTSDASSVADQSASPTDTSISNFQQPRNSPTNPYRYTPAFSESTLASITKQPAHTDCSFEDKSIFLFQQTNKYYYTNFSSGDDPTCVLEQPPTSNVSFLQERYASASGVSTSLSQQRLDFQNSVPQNTISFSGNSSVSVKQQPRNNFQPAIDDEDKFSATRQVSNLHFQQTGESPKIEGVTALSRRFPITFNLLKNQNLPAPAPVELVTLCPDHMAETSSSSKQATAKSLKQKGVISSKKLSPSKGPVAAERPKQKKESLSSDKIISPSKKQAAAVSSRKKKDAISLFELTSPSKELATGINQIQMIRSSSSSFEQRTSSEKQETSVRPKQKKGASPFSIETSSLSNKQETALHLRQKTGTPTSPSLKNKPTAATPRYRTRSQSVLSSKEHPH